MKNGVKFIEKVVPTILFVNVIGVFFTLMFTKVLDLFDYDGGSFVSAYIGLSALFLVAATGYTLLEGAKEVMAASWSGVAPVSGAIPNGDNMSEDELLQQEAQQTASENSSVIMTDEVIETPTSQMMQPPTMTTIAESTTESVTEPITATSDDAPNISEEEMAAALASFDDDDWYPSEEELRQFM